MSNKIIAHNSIILTGRTFGRWTVIGESSKRKNLRYWNCACKCGTKRQVFQGSLTSGSSTSCGCISKERMTSHGMCKRPEFKVWDAMIGRCTRESQVSYKNYGGRGIKVCDRWLSSFALFISDVGFRPNSGYDIDRIDNNGNYNPNNVRWVKRGVNLQNKRTMSKYGFKGVSQNKNSKRFYATIQFEGKRIRLGGHRTKEEAARAYDIAATKYYGEHAMLNFKREVNVTNIY